jgi:hypothetical protein
VYAEGNGIKIKYIKEKNGQRKQNRTKGKRLRDERRKKRIKQEEK